MKYIHILRFALITSLILLTFLEMSATITQDRSVILGTNPSTLQKHTIIIQDDIFGVSNLEHIVSNLTISWGASFEAITYTIELKHQITLAKYSQETANTSATFTNIPYGTYNVLVTAKRADGSTSIVIEDISEL